MVRALINRQSLRLDLPNLWRQVNIFFHFFIEEDGFFLQVQGALGFSCEAANCSQVVHGKHYDNMFIENITLII